MKIEAADVRQVGSAIDDQIPTADFEIETVDGAIYSVTATTQEGLDKIRQLNQSLDPDEKFSEDLIIVDDPEDQNEVLQAI
ncbi:MAG TPA: hypothetical protein VIK81_03820, partial [Patescibacteria group bacterium]